MLISSGHEYVEMMPEPAQVHDGLYDAESMDLDMVEKMLGLDGLGDGFLESDGLLDEEGLEGDAEVLR